jgi:flap endonuclease-1
MGIKGLYAFIKKNAPGAIETISQEELRGKTVTIDASQTVHKYVRAILGTGAKISTKRGEFSAHLMAIVNKTLFYVRKRIFPLYVFDGDDHGHDLKRETLDERKEKREASSSEAVQFVFKDWMVKDVKKLLDFMGIPWVQAVGEADAQCARFTQSSTNKGKKTKAISYAVVSDDGDMLTYGATRLIRELDSRTNAAVVISLSKTLEGLGLTMDKFIDLCILMGCDYCPTLLGIGPVKAFKLIKEEKSIVKWAIRTKQDPKWIKRFVKSQEIFTDSKTISPRKVRPVWMRPDFDGLCKYLKYMSFETADNKVEALKKYYNDWRTSAKQQLRKRNSDTSKKTGSRRSD